MSIKKDTECFIKEYTDGIRALRDKISAMVVGLPDNPDITRLPGSGNCFVMSSRNFSTTNWSPFYYDFKAQYQKVIEIIDGANPLQIGDVIQSIVDKGTYYIGGHTWKFNPVVVANLAEVFDGSRRN